MSSPYTLIIPTYERPHLLKKLLGFLAAERFVYPVMVLDSGSDASKAENQRFCASVELTVEHVAYPHEIHPAAKLLAGVQRTASSYVSICADDDVVLPESLVRSIHMLDERPDAVGCHGRYFSFTQKPTAGGMPTVVAEYWGPSIDGDDPPTRIMQLMCNYEAVFYAVFRRDCLTRIFELMVRLDDPHFQELVSAVVPAWFGKILRHDSVHMYRNSDAPAPDPRITTNYDTTRNFPTPWFLREPEVFFKAYLDYRAVMLEFAQAEDPVGQERFTKVFDIAHRYYLHRSFDKGYMFARMEQMYGVRGLVMEPAPRPQVEQAPAVARLAEYWPEGAPQREDLDRGRRLRKAGELQAALQALKTAVSKNSYDVDVWIELTLLLASAGAREAAYDSIRTALEIRPDHQHALLLAIDLAVELDWPSHAAEYQAALNFWHPRS